MPVADIHPALRDRVMSIAVFDTHGGENNVLPSTSAVLGFQLGGHVDAAGRRLSRIGITGIQPTVRTYAYAPATRSVLVRFTPQGAACFGVPASELAGRSVALDDILGPSRARDILARLDAAAKSLQMFESKLIIHSSNGKFHAKPLSPAKAQFIFKLY